MATLLPVWNTHFAYRSGVRRGYDFPDMDTNRCNLVESAPEGFARSVHRWRWIQISVTIFLALIGVSFGVLAR
jgi:hypothetical protein